MSEISASEQRLAAALDRIDRSLERRIAGAGSDGDAALRAENARLVAAIAALQDEAARAAEAVVAAGDAGGESRLAAANEDLVAANRALIDAAEDGGAVEAATAALRAEIAALQAVRATEMAQMGGILDAIEGLLAAPVNPAEEDR